MNEKAIFAGGCFWCTESSLRKIPGVIEVVSGYTGGPPSSANYEDVCGGASGHVEAIEIAYDSQKVSFEALLDAFWREIDPTDAAGQFADRGAQYEAIIFYLNEPQKAAAEASKERLAKSGRFARPIVTRIMPALPFYSAEDYHQNYAGKNSTHYKQYRYGSGRESFLKRVWCEK